MKYKDVIKSDEIPSRIKALLSDPDIGHDLIYLDTNVIIENEAEITELIKNGASIIVSSVVVQELSAAPEPGIFSLKRGEYKRLQHVVSLMLHSKNVKIIEPKRGRTLRMLEKVAPLTLKLFIYNKLLERFYSIWAVIQNFKIEYPRAGDRVDIIESTLAEKFEDFVSDYEDNLRVNIRDVWGDMHEFWHEYKVVVKHLLLKIHELSISLGPGDVNTAKKRFEQAGKNDLHRDLLIAESYLDHVHPLGRNHRLLSHDKDLRELVCLALAYEEKGLLKVA